VSAGQASAATGDRALSGGRSRSAIRFLFQVGQQQMSFAELRDFFVAMEQAGFAGGYLYDHFLPVAPPEDDPVLEAWTALAALAASTRTSTVGVLVGGVTYRPPGLLAKMAATVDALSGGRLEVGLGTAWHAREHRAFGFALPGVKQRLEMLDEQCTILRALWRGERVDHCGAHYALERAVVRPIPERGTIPLIVAARGERVALAIAARHADVWNASGTPDETLRRRRILDRHCAACGRPPAEIATSVLVPFELVDDRRVAREALEAIARTRQSSPDSIAAATLIGTADELASRIAAFQEAGVRDLVLMAGRPLKRAALERFAHDVMRGFA
jgi:alkanesulfonate monooxygenase SsuD/methylene tetrahydromethanopterin reductase-like flavin-dependent oxidoreductase (luciferase family)